MADETFPFDSDENDEEPDEGDKAAQAEDNKTIKQMRDALDRAEKRAKAFEKQVEKLSEFQTEVLAERKDKALTSVFTEVGLNPKHAKLFQRVNPELEVDAITAEAVSAFAAEYELATSSGDVPDAPEVKPEGFTPVTTGTAAPDSKLSGKDIKELLLKGDDDAVARAFKAGRVQQDKPWR